MFLAKLKTAWSTAEAAVKAKVAVGVVVGAVAAGGIGVGSYINSTTIKLSNDAQLLLEQMIECFDPDPFVFTREEWEPEQNGYKGLRTLDYSVLIENMDEETTQLRFENGNGKKIPWGIFYDQEKSRFVDELTGYGACFFDDVITIGMFEDGKPVDSIYIINLNYTTSGYSDRTNGEHFLETTLLELDVEEDTKKENAKMSVYVDLAGIESMYDCVYEEMYFTGILGCINEKDTDEKVYSFIGDTRGTYRYVHDGYQDIEYDAKMEHSIYIERLSKVINKYLNNN